jgi:hypothetical protein
MLSFEPHDTPYLGDLGQDILPFLKYFISELGEGIILTAL